jgi:ornithine cyclodeaminase
VPIFTVSSEQVRATVSMRDAIDGLREGFRALARGEFEMPVRTALLEGRFLVMPCTHLPSRSTIVKTLSVELTRTPAIAGAVVWTELDRPDTLAVDAAAVTALRTGAAAGVATDLLAAPDAAALTLFGTGAQALDQVRAVDAVRPLRQVVIVDTGSARVAALAETISTELPDAQVRTEPDVATAVREADVICCATSATAPLFDLAMLPARVHVNAIGSYRPGMRELPDDVLTAGTLVVDDIAAALEESGEVSHALQSGVLDAAGLITLGAALADPPPQTPRTVFKSVGLAMQDWVVARLLAQRLLPEPSKEAACPSTG